MEEQYKRKTNKSKEEEIKDLAKKRRKIKSKTVI